MTPTVEDGSWSSGGGVGPRLAMEHGHSAVLMHDKPLRRAVPLGIIMGLWIFAAYWIAWTVVGPCEGAILQLPCAG